MFRLVRVESVKAREDSEPVFDTGPRVPRIYAKRAERSHPKKRRSQTGRNPDPDGVPNSQLFSISGCIFPPEMV